MFPDPFQSFDKTDEDYDLDDVFMTRAARKQSDSKQEEKDRSAAVYGQLSFIVLKECRILLLNSMPTAALAYKAR